MRKIIFIIPVILLIVILVVLINSYFAPTTTSEPTPTPILTPTPDLTLTSPQTPKETGPREVGPPVKKEFYKGAGIFFVGAAPLGDEYKPVLMDLNRAAEDGVDSLVFGPMFYANKEGEVILFPGTKDFLISFIDEAHARGFKIWLCPSITYDIKGIKNLSEELKTHRLIEVINKRPIPDEVIENTDVMQNFESAVIEWAKIAEEHDVEIFSPIGEAHFNFGTKRIGMKWLAEVKPKIEAVYTGKICTKGEVPYPEWNFPDLLVYSCNGPSIEIPRNKEQEDELVKTIDRWYEETKKRNIELIIGDIWEGPNWNGTTEDANRGFAKVFEAGEGKVSGFFVTDFPHFLPPYEHLAPVHFEDFESAVKEFYTRQDD